MLLGPVSPRISVLLQATQIILGHDPGCAHLFLLKQLPLFLPVSQKEGFMVGTSGHFSQWLFSLKHDFDYDMEKMAH